MGPNALIDCQATNMNVTLRLNKLREVIKTMVLRNPPTQACCPNNNINKVSDNLTKLNNAEYIIYAYSGDMEFSVSNLFSLEMTDRFILFFTRSSLWPYTILSEPCIQ